MIDPFIIISVTHYEVRNILTTFY